MPQNCRFYSHNAMRLALYQPDIPQNAGALIRLGACLGVGLDIIGPAGFTYTQRELQRAAMDYAAFADVATFSSWQAYLADRSDSSGRLVLLTTKASLAYTRFDFAADDTLLLGRESAGVPEAVHRSADARIRVPLEPQARSLNVALAAAMVLGEAMRQTGIWPGAEGA